MRAVSRSISRSTKRAWGIVISTKRIATIVTAERLKALAAMMRDWLKASTIPHDLDEGGILLQANEVVKQRRHDAAHRLGARSHSAWSACRRGRASAPLGATFYEFGLNSLYFA
ncbi:hypothetical protein MES5069_270067 [Mesorhizobium escarrei]|uniref:Uncharacterized protein n=1 Tax=Mesorhizobium escarrei TaxID=666018 RepID=A0ABN8JU99_9HYPH|nr:hypothetical protein MES5069_270067 [Mesorhizobium escarrei]